MAPLHSLVTALIRLLALHFAIRAIDNTAAPILAIIMQSSALPAEAQFEMPNPFALFLPIVAFYAVLAVVIFFAAPKLARLMLGSGTESDSQVPWHETLLFCTGILIISWAFARLTDTIYGLAMAAAGNPSRYTPDTAVMIYLFMTAVLFLAGIFLIAKFPKISAWITARRAAATRPRE